MDNIAQFAQTHSIFFVIGRSTARTISKKKVRDADAVHISRASQVTALILQKLGHAKDIIYLVEYYTGL